jgi:hypothetical protein
LTSLRGIEPLIFTALGVAAVALDADAEAGAWPALPEVVGTGVELPAGAALVDEDVPEGVSSEL